MYNEGAILTNDQAIELSGAMYTDYSYFNPFLINDVWMITIQEIEFCTNEQYMWVKNLPIVPIPEQISKPFPTE
jgi:hypothetical protein